MNSKKVKQIRKQLKAKGIDPKQTAYVKENIKQKPIYGIDAEGKEAIVGTYNTFSLVLGDCGRAVYKAVCKKVESNNKNK